MLEHQMKKAQHTIVTASDFGNYFIQSSKIDQCALMDILCQLIAKNIMKFISLPNCIDDGSCMTNVSSEDIVQTTVMEFFDDIMKLLFSDEGVNGVDMEMVDKNRYIKDMHVEDYFHSPVTKINL